ncbi:MAG: hypothetical protein ACI9LO_003517 [Planctomycetota bacterium]|jgi:hypothetical protein
MKKTRLSMIYALVSFLLLIGLFVLPPLFPAIVRLAPNLFFWASPVAAIGGLIVVLLAIREGEIVSQLITPVVLNLLCLFLFGGILWMTGITG